MTSVKLTIFFEGMFWVGVFERQEEEEHELIKYEVCRVVFGPEPKDYEVHEFVLKNFNKLKFSNCLILDKTKQIKEDKINPKRLQRKVRKETGAGGIGTKAQNALKQQYEANKQEQKKTSREQKELEEQRKFELRQQKKLEKHKGH